MRENDIGKMIDDELKGYKAPDSSAPLGDIKDTRTPMQRAADMDKADRERKAEKEISELRAGWEKQEKAKEKAAEEPVKAAERELKKNDAEVFASDYDALKALPAGSVEADEKKQALVADLIEKRTVGNTELGSRFIKLGMLYPEEVKFHAYTEILKQVQDRIKENAAIDKRLDTFLQGPATPEKVMEQLQKTTDKEIEAIFAGMIGDLEAKYGRRQDKKENKAAAPIQMRKPEGQPLNKQAEVSKATEPFFNEVKEMLEKKPGAKKPEKKKGGFLKGLIDRFTGKKAA